MRTSRPANLPLPIGISDYRLASSEYYIRYLLPYSALAGTDRTNSLQQFTKIIFTKSLFSLLQAFIIHCKTFYHIF